MKTAFIIFLVVWTIVGAILACAILDTQGSMKDWTKKQIIFVAFFLGPFAWLVAGIGFSLHYLAGVWERLGKK